MLRLIPHHSCSITPERLPGKNAFDELLGLLLRDDFVRPRKVTVQERSAFAIGDFAIDFEKSAGWICLSHCDRALEVETW